MTKIKTRGAAITLLALILYQYFIVTLPLSFEKCRVVAPKHGIKSSDYPLSPTLEANGTSYRVRSSVHHKENDTYFKLKSGNTTLYSFSIGYYQTQPIALSLTYNGRTPDDFNADIGLIPIAYPIGVSFRIMRNRVEFEDDIAKHIRFFPIPMTQKMRVSIIELSIVGNNNLGHSIVEICQSDRITVLKHSIPKNYTLVIGDDFHLFCHFRGPPSITVRWEYYDYFENTFQDLSNRFDENHYKLLLRKVILGDEAIVTGSLDFLYGIHHRHPCGVTPGFYRCTASANDSLDKYFDYEIIFQYQDRQVLPHDVTGYYKNIVSNQYVGATTIKYRELIKDMTLECPGQEKYHGSLATEAERPDHKKCHVPRVFFKTKGILSMLENQEYIIRRCVIKHNSIEDFEEQIIEFIVCKFEKCPFLSSHCKRNHYGFGFDCKACPESHLSRRYSYFADQCYSTESNCPSGEYGIKDECQKCLRNQTSRALKAVKSEDCFCEPNYYGSYSGCKICPNGKISNENTTKLSGCYIPADLNCTHNFYGYRGNCTQCPPGSGCLSSTAAKPSDCQAFCPSGYYGLGEACIICPVNSTSLSGWNLFPEECYCSAFTQGNDDQVCRSVFTIDKIVNEKSVTHIIVMAVLVVLIILFMVVFYYFNSRRLPKRCIRCSS